MTIESIMNFNVGQKVKLNPDNHGFCRQTQFEKRRDIEGTIVNMQTKTKTSEKGYLLQSEVDYCLQILNGRMCIKWDGDYFCRQYDYKNLKIVS